MEPDTENLDALFDECRETGINPFGSGPVPIGPRMTPPHNKTQVRPAHADPNTAAPGGQHGIMEAR